MGQDILAIDVGTSGLKLGLYAPDLELRMSASQEYEPELREGGQADVHPETWWTAIASACHEVGPALEGVGVVSLSVTTPGLTPMAADGRPLGPAILFLDGRSHEQAAAIRASFGEERFLAEACNLPVSGGSSLASILWIRDHRPDIWKQAAKFGHTNTYVAKRMTGRWAIDPSTTSITGLYATTRNDLTWNADVLEAAGLEHSRLPPLMHSFDRVGEILPAVADELGVPRGAVVLCGGNDAALAAWSGGLSEPGDANIISGTCDIANVCTAGRWHQPSSTSEPMSCPAGGSPSSCSTPEVWPMTGSTRRCAGRWTRSSSTASTCPRPWRPSCPTPTSRPVNGHCQTTCPTSVAAATRSNRRRPRTPASASGRRARILLLSMIRGNLRYLGTHFAQVSRLVPVNHVVGISGGAARIRGMLEARARWTGDYEYRFQDQSSMLGAAMLGRIYQDGGLA